MRGVFSKGRPLASPVSWTGIYGFFLLTVFILWVPSSGYQNIVWPKHLLFLWATALFVLGLVPMVLIQKARQSLPRRWTGADRHPLCLAAGLLLLFLLSALASPYPDVVWLGNRRYEGFLTLALYLVIFISAALWGRLAPCMSPEPLCPLSWSPPWSWPSFWGKILWACILRVWAFTTGASNTAESTWAPLETPTCCRPISPWPACTSGGPTPCPTAGSGSCICPPAWPPGLLCFSAKWPPVLPPFWAA